MVADRNKARAPDFTVLRNAGQGDPWLAYHVRKGEMESGSDPVDALSKLLLGEMALAAPLQRNPNVRLEDLLRELQRIALLQELDLRYIGHSQYGWYLYWWVEHGRDKQGSQSPLYPDLRSAVVGEIERLQDKELGRVSQEEEQDA